MKKITIEGKFTGEVNNFLDLDVYTSNASSTPYNLSKKLHGDFTKIMDDLNPNTKYYIDFGGYTTTSFTLKISGDFNQPNPITKTFNAGAFDIGFTIKTNL